MLSQFLQKSIHFSPLLTKQKRYLCFFIPSYQIRPSSLNFKCKNEFFKFFSKEKKVTTIEEKMKDGLNSLRKENNEEKQMDKIFKMLVLIQEAQERKNNSVEIREQMFAYIDQLEEIIEDYQKDWPDELRYDIKCRLLKTIIENNQEHKKDKYINAFLEEYFIKEIFIKLDSQMQYLAIHLVCEELLIQGKPQAVIEFCKLCLNQYNQEEISKAFLQQIFAFIAQGYKKQNAHKQAFEEIEKVIQNMECETYFNDIAQHEEITIQSISQIVRLCEYCFQYQQYDKALRLEDNLISHIDQRQKILYDRLSYSITIMKNLNKHYKILLSLNKKISSQLSHHKEEGQQIDLQIEAQFIHSFEKFLKLQKEYISHFNCAIKMYSQPLLQHMLSFSPDGKHQLLKISHKYDCLSI